MCVYLSVVVYNCLRSTVLFFLHGPSPQIDVWWCTEHWNHLCIISGLFLFCHLHLDGQPCVEGFHFRYRLRSHYPCVMPIWILTTPIRECSFKYYITPKSCYSYHVRHEDINANSYSWFWHLFPYREVAFPSVNHQWQEKISSCGHGWGRYIIFSSINVSSIQWHYGVKSSSSDFSRYWYGTNRPALVPALPVNSFVTLSKLHFSLGFSVCIYKVWMTSHILSSFKS